MENHVIQIDNRQRLSVTEVTDIDSFDEEEIRANLKTGGLLLKGKNLHIQKLDLTEGKSVINGEIHSLAYTRRKEKNNGSWLKKLFK